MEGVVPVPLSPPQQEPEDAASTDDELLSSSMEGQSIFMHHQRKLTEIPFLIFLKLQSRRSLRQSESPIYPLTPIPSLGSHWSVVGFWNGLEARVCVVSRLSFGCVTLIADWREWVSCVIAARRMLVEWKPQWVMSTEYLKYSEPWRSITKHIR